MATQTIAKRHSWLISNRKAEGIGFRRRRPTTVSTYTTSITWVLSISNFRNHLNVCPDTQLTAAPYDSISHNALSPEAQMRRPHSPVAVMLLIDGDYRLVDKLSRVMAHGYLCFIRRYITLNL